MRGLRIHTSSRKVVTYSIRFYYHFIIQSMTFYSFRPKFGLDLAHQKILNSDLLTRKFDSSQMIPKPYSQQMSLEFIEGQQLKSQKTSTSIFQYLIFVHAKSTACHKQSRRRQHSRMIAKQAGAKRLFTWLKKSLHSAIKRLKPVPD